MTGSIMIHLTKWGRETGREASLFVDLVIFMYYVMSLKRNDELNKKEKNYVQAI